MTNEQRIQLLESQIRELLAWKERREAVQLQYPVDDQSKYALEALIWKDNGTAATTDLNLTGNAQTITIPTLPDGVKLVDIKGEQIKIPFYNI